MALRIWVDPTSHWKATGDVVGSGAMSGATVEDQDGTTRSRDESFSSEDAFRSWVRNHR